MEEQKYKVTISLVSRKEVNETTDVYINKKTGEVLDWNGWYELGKEDKKAQSKFEEIQQETGKTTIVDREETIYEQELDDLNVGDLAVYINRAS